METLTLYVQVPTSLLKEGTPVDLDNFIDAAVKSSAKFAVEQRQKELQGVS